MSVAAADHALALPWLAPSAGSLAALARGPGADAWKAVRHDPAAVLLVARAAVPKPPLRLAALDHPAVLDIALRGLGASHPCDFAAWDAPSVGPVHRTAVAHATLAADIAARSGRCDRDTAHAAGLLAPLGWLALAAAQPSALAACRADLASADDPAAVEARHWGMTHAALARRLATRWRLPEWVAAVAGHLDLSPRDAAAAGVDAGAFACVQLAALLLDRAGVGLRLAGGASAEDAAAALGLDVESLDGLAAAAAVKPPPRAWHDPAESPLLPDLLAAAVENRRLKASPVLEPLHARIDRLHAALVGGRRDAEVRLHDAKLSALAELAAGAGHEINNPLAVISGRAQYLLSKEEDADKRASLEAIVRQAHRAHDILTGLMQFARPPRPDVKPVTLGDVLRQAADDVAWPAAAKSLRLDVAESGVVIDADPAHVRTAVLALVRNAVEAAPENGRVRVAVEAGPAAVRVVVEDSGPGPTPQQREHLFDPFYSGRPAGRGRGLGLPTAWRLARQLGGDVRFEPTPAGAMTRFVLTLPARGAGRLSA